jgi:hypothetical protein
VRTLLWASLLFLSAAACRAESASYFPLASGVVSHYDMTAGGTSARATLSNLEARDLGGVRVVPRKTEIGDASSSATAFEFFAADAVGTYKLANQAPTDAEPRLLQSKEYFIREPIRVGTHWSGTSDEAMGQRAEPYTVAITGTDETVTVPLGTFQHCLKTERREHTNQGMGAGREIVRINWYARNIGLVKQITRQGDRVLESMQLVSRTK